VEKIAYIVIHGFGGTPNDIKNIKKELILNGIDEQDIYTPLLKGHGIKGKIKIGTRYEDIITELKEYVDNNCNKYDKIYLFGYSMGGLVSMGLAINAKVDKLVLFNAPMHIWNFRNFLWTIKTKKPRQKVYHIKTVLSSLNYTKIRNSMELRRLRNYVRDNLKNITSDTYIIQSVRDYVAQPVSAEEIYNEIGSKEKKIKWYQETTHFMPDEECINDVICDSLNWTNMNYV